MDGDKPTKPPVNPDTGRFADTKAPSTWGAFNEALDRMHHDDLPGIGFVLSPTDDIAGIDLDHCVDPETHQIEAWAQEIIDSFMPTYAEYSPSETGIRVFVRGRLDGDGCKTGNIEVYDQKRYLTITGHPIVGAAETIAERQDALTTLYRLLRAERGTEHASGTLKFTTDLDGEGAAILARVRPQEPGERPPRSALTERIWKIAHGDDAILKPIKDGLVPYKGESERRYAVVCALYDIGLTDDEVRAAFKATTRWGNCVAEHGIQEAERKLTTQDMPNAKGFAQQQRENTEQGTRTAESDGRLAVDAGNHNLPEVTQQAWDALMTRNDPPYLYQHGGMPTRLQEDTDGRTMLVPLTEHRLRCEVAQSAHWYVVKGKEQRPIAAEPPLSVVQNMVAQARLPLPVLKRITETPVFAPDGRLIEAPGYDVASGIYYRPVAGLDIPAVQSEPSTEDVERAREMLSGELLRDFPFAGDADRAGAIALLLLPFVREMIAGKTPMHGIESPTVGSGKGLLADCLTRPAFGSYGGILTEGRDDDEWRKRIGAKLREGAPLIQIDNITRPLDSGALASALTTDVFSDRLLGRNESFVAPVRCIWVFTANNPTMSTEIARRTIRIRIDPQTDRPWQRTEFRHANLRKWTDEHRGELIRAALTLIRAWIVAGKPTADVTLGSYEQWAATMGGILHTAGIPAFLTNLDEFYEVADLEGAAWRQFIALWWENHQGDKAGVSDLFELAGDVDGLDFGKGNERAQRISFGMQLNKQRGRVYDSYRVAYAGESKRAKQWRLIPVKPGGGESNQQRFTQVFAAIATEREGGVNQGECFTTHPAQEKVGSTILYTEESENIHRDSPPPGIPLVSQGESRVNQTVIDSPTADVDVLHQWCGDIDAGRVTHLPRHIRPLAQRHGFTFDSFGDVQQEAVRLAAHLAKNGAQ